MSARKILLLAFAGECLERMKPGSARTHAERLIHEYLLSVASHSPDREEADLHKAGTERTWEEVG